MPRSYRRKPLETRSCQHCHRLYETRYMRTKYCSNSCRGMACMARKGPNSPVEIAQVVESDSGLENLGTATLGGAMGQILNYYVSDQPYRAELNEKLATLQRSIDELKEKLDQNMLSLGDQRLLEQAQQVMDKEAKRLINAGR